MRARAAFVMASALAAASTSCTSSAPSAPALPAKPVEVTTARVEHEHYTVDAERERCAQAPCALRATVTAKAPFHANAEYPHRFVVDGAAVVGDQTVSPVGADGLLRVQATSGTKADERFSGRLFMSVCSDEKCLIEKVPLSL